MSDCVGFPEAKACWAQSGLILGPGFFDKRAVVSAVFMVLICHLIKPLDLGKWGDEVECSMWCHTRNSVSSLDAEGWPLSKKSIDGGLYCDMSLSSHVHRDWAVLEDTFYKNGYLLKVLQIKR